MNSNHQTFRGAKATQSNPWEAPEPEPVPATKHAWYNFKSSACRIWKATVVPPK